MMYLFSCLDRKLFLLLGIGQGIDRVPLTELLRKLNLYADECLDGLRKAHIQLTYQDLILTYAKNSYRVQNEQTKVYL